MERRKKGVLPGAAHPFIHRVNQRLLGGEFLVVLDVDAPIRFARQLASAEVVVGGGSILLEHLDVLDAIFLVDHIETEFTYILRVVTELEVVTVGRNVSIGIGLLHQVILLVTLENVGLHVGSIRVGDLLERKLTEDTRTNVYFIFKPGREANKKGGAWSFAFLI